MFDHEAWIGLTHDIEGDVRTIGRLGGADGAYRSAVEHYRELEKNTNVHEYIAWIDELGFDTSFYYLLRLLRGLARDLDEETRTTIESRSLVARIEYKQAKLPTLLEELEERGEWVWEDDQQ